MNNLPSGAIVVVTSRCNSRCLMCDIWKKESKKEVNPKIYHKLPSSLKSIDITGGEPFLRGDLIEIVSVLKRSCPRARLLITTNGLLVKKIRKATPKLVKIDKNLAFRVSMDGPESVHDRIRGVPGAFKKAKEALVILKENGVGDLGVIFTLMAQNKSELEKVLDFCRKENLKFSMNLVHDSSIYFGNKHLKLRPSFGDINKSAKLVSNFYKRSIRPQDWAKAWFYQKTSGYVRSNKRPLSCGAGKDFFYLDPLGDIYVCHIKDWKIGNLEKQSFTEIWNGEKRKSCLQKVKNCNDCWMICTAKDRIKKKKVQVLKDLFHELLFRK